ncbi:MAG: hypothetical protein EPO61_06295 [Nitrospirae bacterium]|nr:MAG: hypothetical protein EPO61_06295 [Nitrospirota bacterium]
MSSALCTAMLAWAWGLILLPGWSGAAMVADITFTAQEFAFTGPDRIDQGWRSVRLANQGRDIHQVLFLKLPPNKTAEDFRSAIEADWSQLPSWIQRAGGVNSVAPGQEARAIILLEPGDYVVICGIPDVRGRPHVLHGMMRSLQVTASVQPATQPPDADVTITARDFSFSSDTSLRVGTQTVRMRNSGRQAHEIVFVQLAPGATTQDFVDSFVPGKPDNQAGRHIGGLTGLAPGQEAFFSVDLQPGRYGLICFLSDPVTRAPHFAYGMLLDMDVR